MEGRLLKSVALTSLEHSRVEQIIDLLVVYLKEGDVHLYVLEAAQRLHLLYQLLDASLDQSVLLSALGAFIIDDWEEYSLLGLPVLVAVHGVGLA